MLEPFDIAQRELTSRQFEDELRRIEEEALLRIRAHTSELPDDSPEARAARRERGKTDRFWFFEHYFPHLFDEPFGPLDFAWAKARDKHKAFLDMEHRGRGKSTREIYAETIREIATGASLFTVLTGRTDTETTLMVFPTRLEWEANQRLIQDYGDLAFGILWRQNHYILKNGREVKGLSRKQGIRGQRSIGRNLRPDRWKLDDFQNDQDARNPESIDKIINEIEGGIFPAMAKTGYKVIAVGTPLSHDCAIMRLERHPAWGVFRLPAVSDLQKLTPTDPVRFPKKFLAEKLVQLGSLKFNREYGLVAVKLDAMVLPEWIHRFDPDEVARRRLIVAVYMDPAISPKGRDYKAIVMDGCDLETGRWYTLAAFIRKQASPGQCSLAFWRMVREAKENPLWTVVCGFEANGMQALMDWPMDEARRKLGLPDIGVAHVVNLVEKDVRVAELVPAFERGRRFFARGNPDVETLISQWLYYPDMGRDGPDAQRGAAQLIVSAANRAATGGGRVIPSSIPTQPGAF